MSAADTSPPGWMLEAAGTSAAATCAARRSQPWRVAVELAGAVPLATRLRLLILIG